MRLRAFPATSLNLAFILVEMMTILLLVQVIGSITEDVVIRLLKERHQQTKMPIQTAEQVSVPFQLLGRKIQKETRPQILHPQPRGLGIFHTVTLSRRNPHNYDQHMNKDSENNSSNNSRSPLEARKLNFDPDSVFLQPTNDIQIRDGVQPSSSLSLHTGPTTSNVFLNEYEPDATGFYQNQNYLYPRTKSTTTMNSVSIETVKPTGKSPASAKESGKVDHNDDDDHVGGEEEEKRDMAKEETGDLVTEDEQSSNKLPSQYSSKSNETQIKEESPNLEELRQNYFNSFPSSQEIADSTDDSFNKSTNDSNNGLNKSVQGHKPTKLIKSSEVGTTKNRNDELSSMLTFLSSTTPTPKNKITMTTSTRINFNQQRPEDSVNNFGLLGDGHEEFVRHEGSFDESKVDLENFPYSHQHATTALNHVSTSLVTAVGFVLASILTLAIALLKNIGNYQTMFNGSGNRRITFTPNHISSSNYKIPMPQPPKASVVRTDFPNQFHSLLLRHLESPPSFHTSFNDNYRQSLGGMFGRRKRRRLIDNHE